MVREPPPNRGNSANAITSRISTAIMERRLPPGTKLVEHSLGQIFGVSRTKVREAFFQLAKEKLITLHPARGAFVARPSAQESREIFEARRILESAIAAKFSERASRKELEALRRHIARERKAITAGDVASSAKLSGEFHLMLADMAGNTVVSEILRELVSRTSLIIVLYESSLPGSCSYQDHERILKNIASAEAQRAARAMVQHLEDIEHNLHLKDSAPGPIDLISALAAT